MLQLVVRFQMVVLLAATAIIFFAPMAVLQALGLPGTNELHSLLRVISCLLAVVAAASMGLTHIPWEMRGSVFTAMGLAYGAMSVMLLAQHIAIWQGILGAVLVAVCAGQGCAFLYLASRERTTPALGA